MSDHHQIPATPFTQPLGSLAAHFPKSLTDIATILSAQGPLPVPDNVNPLYSFGTMEEAGRVPIGAVFLVLNGAYGTETQWGAYKKISSTPTQSIFIRLYMETLPPFGMPDIGYLANDDKAVFMNSLYVHTARTLGTMKVRFTHKEHNPDNFVGVDAPILPPIPVVAPAPQAAAAAMAPHVAVAPTPGVINVVSKTKQQDSYGLNAIKAISLMRQDAYGAVVGGGLAWSGDIEQRMKNLLTDNQKTLDYVKDSSKFEFLLTGKYDTNAGSLTSISIFDLTLGGWYPTAFQLWGTLRRTMEIFDTIGRNLEEPVNYRYYFDIFVAMMEKVVVDQDPIDILGFLIQETSEFFKNLGVLFRNPANQETLAIFGTELLALCTSDPVRHARRLQAWRFNNSSSPPKAAEAQAADSGGGGLKRGRDNDNRRPRDEKKGKADNTKRMCMHFLAYLTKLPGKFNCKGATACKGFSHELLNKFKKDDVKRDAGNFFKRDPAELQKVLDFIK